MFSRIAALPLWAKVLLAVAALVALGLFVLLSPFMVLVALLVLIVAIFALVIRMLQRRPLRNWGLIALTSFLLLIMFSGITYALYGGTQPEQPSSPSKPAEKPKSTSPEKTEATTETTPETTTESTSTPTETTKEDTQEDQSSNSTGHDATVNVTRVVDGDTIKISPALDGYDEVRLIGVDTPETKEPGCEVQPYGPEASKFTTSELQGEEVELEFDKDRVDPNDRLLAYVYKDDDEMFNETLLKEGYAQVAIFRPNNRYEDRFKQDQEEAKAAERGIWRLSASELAKLKDRGNGIGGDGCEKKAATPPPQPSPQPPVAPPPSSAAGRSAPLPDGSCPPDSPIKGNADSGIYHVPGGQYYNKTKAEACFATASDAQSAGFRASKR